MCDSILVLENSVTLLVLEETSIINELEFPFLTQPAKNKTDANMI